LRLTSVTQGNKSTNKPYKPSPATQSPIPSVRIRNNPLLHNTTTTPTTVTMVCASPLIHPESIHSPSQFNQRLHKAQPSHSHSQSQSQSQISTNTQLTTSSSRKTGPNPPTTPRKRSVRQIRGRKTRQAADRSRAHHGEEEGRQNRRAEEPREQSVVV
jgi:hypothetical protein